MLSQPPTVDLALLNPILQDAAERGRTMLLPVLHAAQEQYGWLPPEVQKAVSYALRVPLADVHGVVSFYSMFYSTPTAKRVIRVCEDPACSLAGGAAVFETLRARLTNNNGAAAQDGIALEKVTCLGMCEHAPCALDGAKPAGNLNPEQIDALLSGSLAEPRARPYGEPRWLLKRVGKVDPTSLDDYRRTGGYQALARVLALEPEAVISQVGKFGILGRGGAMFPLERKWRFTRQAAGVAGEKHIVVNADESEPGTFKDRCLMEEDPFALIESMTIAAYAVGAENGWIFVRGEYPRCFARLRHAVATARSAGLLGSDIGGAKGFHFDIELRLGAGAYICGEETALFEAIEGRRGFPRIKPPYPPTSGLFNQPTAISNVETLVAMLAALEVGEAAWRAVGTSQSPGTKLFCLSGHVVNPGVYEVPFGTTIRQVLELAGGAAGTLQAVLMGGAAGVFVPPQALDMPLSYEASRETGVPLGSGVIMPFNETVDLLQPLYELGRFFAHESCGKCFPCQLGTQRQMEILGRAVRRGQVTPAEKSALQDIGFAMTETSLCGLGQTAAAAVLSALDILPEVTP